MLPNVSVFLLDDVTDLMIVLLDIGICDSSIAREQNKQQCI